MSKMTEAYKEQDKAPKKGVKADDADEYQAKGSDYDKSVQKSKAYADQDKAPKGRGMRGPSQEDGGPIKDWDKSSKAYGAYEAQEKWGPSSEKASMGFKLSENKKYLGHFAKEEFLRKGHNDGGSISDFMFGTGDDGKAAPAPSPEPSPKPQSTGSAVEETQDSMRKAFKY